MPPQGMPPQGMPPVPPQARPPVPPQGMPPVPPQGFPPAPPQARPPVPPQAMPHNIPPAPPAVQPHAPVAPAAPPAPATPAAPPAPPAPAPMPAQAAAVVMGSEAALSLPAGEFIHAADAGDLLNDGTSVAVIVSDNHLILISPSGKVQKEEVPGIRFAIVGDYDGDGTQDLAIFTETQAWINRYNAHGSVASRKVDQPVPANLARAPITHDGRTVLMSMTPEKVSFFVFHPARGLVEIGSAALPQIEA